MNFKDIKAHKVRLIAQKAQYCSVITPKFYVRAVHSLRLIYRHHGN